LIENGQLTTDEKQKYYKFLDNFSNTPLIIDDKPFNITQLVQDIKLEVARKGIKIVYIDYISFIKEPNLKEINAQNRNQLLGYITKELKRLAKEVQIPIVILGQLNRAVEQGGVSEGRVIQREPELSDIRDSGEIEQDLDIAMFIVRPSQGGYTSFVDQRPAFKRMKFDNGYRDVPMADIVIKKNRNGEIGRVHFAYIKERTLFQEYKDDESEHRNSEVDL
jgi:replicative DNA helicase